MNQNHTSIEGDSGRFTPPPSTDADHIDSVSVSRTEALEAVRSANKQLSLSRFKTLQFAISRCICSITSLTKVQYCIEWFERNLPGLPTRDDQLLIACLVSD